MARKKLPALAYLRTSSATSVGTDRDSDKRQAEAIRSYAARSGFEIVETFYGGRVWREPHRGEVWLFSAS